MACATEHRDVYGNFPLKARKRLTSALQRLCAISELGWCVFPDSRWLLQSSEQRGSRCQSLASDAYHLRLLSTKQIKGSPKIWQKENSRSPSCMVYAKIQRITSYSVNIFFNMNFLCRWNCSRRSAEEALNTNTKASRYQLLSYPNAIVRLYFESVGLAGTASTRRNRSTRRERGAWANHRCFECERLAEEGLELRFLDPCYSYLTCIQHPCTYVQYNFLIPHSSASCLHRSR